MWEVGNWDWPRGYPRRLGGRDTDEPRLTLPCLFLEMATNTRKTLTQFFSQGWAAWGQEGRSSPWHAGLRARGSRLTDKTETPAGGSLVPA